MKTKKENIEQVNNYLDKVSSHVYFDGTYYLIINKKRDNKYYTWEGKEIGTAGTRTEIII